MNKHTNSDITLENILSKPTYETVLDQAQSLQHNLGLLLNEATVQKRDEAYETNLKEAFYTLKTVILDLKDLIKLELK